MTERNRLTSRVFEHVDQRLFADASCDYNPVHIDPVQARRLPAGQVVVHGLHSLIWALDSALKSGVIDRNEDLLHLSVDCRFRKPVFLDEEVDLVSLNSPAPDVRSFAVQAEGTTLLKVSVGRLQERAVSKYPASDNKVVIQSNLQIQSPSLEEMSQAQGHLVLSEMDLESLVQAYASLAPFLGAERFRALVSLSTLVGMIVPGRHSMLTSVKVEFVPSGSTEFCDEVSFWVNDVDERFGTVNLKAMGSGLIAEISAIVRPQPVEPPSLDTLRELIPRNSFEGRSAVVLGGSRGLGAIAVRLLSLGGAEVVGTYHGADDLQNVDLPNFTALPFDVWKMNSASLAPLFQHEPDTLLYFATPKIYFRRTIYPDTDKLNEFKHFYVTAFKKIFEYGQRVRSRFQYCLYPSSVAVEGSDKDDAEYRQAKLEGEALCLSLKDRYPNVTLTHPRLPRLETDQTLGYGSTEQSASTAEYVLDLLDCLYKSSG